MAIGNAPKEKPSLEVQVFRLLRRHPGGVKRAFIDARFRKLPANDVDAALECLKTVGVATCTDGKWWVR